MAGYTAQQLAAPAAQHGGEMVGGRFPLPGHETQRVPNPDYDPEVDLPADQFITVPNTEPIWVITFNDNTTAQMRETRDANGQPTGAYKPIKLPAPPARGGMPRLE